MTALGMPYKHNDFGASLAYFGVPRGPYLVILGPFSLREEIGLSLGWGLSLTEFSGRLAFDNIDRIDNEEIRGIFNITGGTVSILEAMFIYEQFKSSIEHSFDEYSFVRDSIWQIRRARLDLIETYD